MAAKDIPRRGDYNIFYPITTRWMDNDIYGHINNVQYYSYFDTAVNRYLIEQGVLDIHQGAVIGLVVETHCNFFSGAAFPQDIEVGIRVAHLGNSSVRYEVGLFVEGREDAIAQGHFVHVYVDRNSQQPVAITDDLRSALDVLVCE
ncbi:MAG: acyl-CoA thioesterase [Gammaproteobacteria bacterium]|nr:acyl-CoA thioesterase [Gammaproteobacteria bacterium]